MAGFHANFMLWKDYHKIHKVKIHPNQDMFHFCRSGSPLAVTRFHLWRSMTRSPVTRYMYGQVMSVLGALV